MIVKALALTFVLALPSAHAQHASQNKKGAVAPIVGTWNLIRYADTPKGGKEINVFGKSPIGQFIFTEDGHMSVHIMHNPPDPKDAVVDPDPEACIPAWYCGYFGTYSLDPAGHFWVGHVLGGNIPAYIGTDQKRTFTIVGDRLLISETYVSEGVPVTAERVLVRNQSKRN